MVLDWGFSVVELAEQKSPSLVVLAEGHCRALVEQEWPGRWPVVGCEGYKPAWGTSRLAAQRASA